MNDPSPCKRALLIGITEYPNLSPLNRLRGCVNDVNLIRDLLLKRFEFEDKNIKTVCEKEATREGIRKAFTSLVKSVKEKDDVVVFFAGHGSSVGDKNKGSGKTETIVPYESGRILETGHPSTDISDMEIYNLLVGPLLQKASSVTLIFDSCHSGSILRDDFSTAVRGIEPDIEIETTVDFNSAERSGWLTTLQHRGGALMTEGRFALLAACRAQEVAKEVRRNRVSYGAFTHSLCEAISQSDSGDIRTLFQLASAAVTAHFPLQHPILECAQDARIFGVDRLQTPRCLSIKAIKDDGKVVELNGGRISGVTRGSIWAVRPLNDSPQDSDTRIRIEEASTFISRAEVIHKGPLMIGFGCFEISHVRECPANLDIIVDSNAHSDVNEELLQGGHSSGFGSLTIVDHDDAKIGFVKILQRPDTKTWVACRDNRDIFRPTTDLSELCTNLRKYASYCFGLTLRNPEENDLREKVGFELRWRKKDGEMWKVVQRKEMGGFPHFQTDDQISCVIANRSEHDVWVYVLEFAEDGSVHQRYPYNGGEELLARDRTIKGIAPMKLCLSEENVFQLATRQRSDRRGVCVMEMLKLIASTEPVDLSSLTQPAFSFRSNPGARGLSSLLRIGVPDPNTTRGVSHWCTVERAFTLSAE